MKKKSIFLLASALIAGCQSFLVPQEKMAVTSVEEETIESKDLSTSRKKILIPRILNKSRYGGEELAVLTTLKTREYLTNYNKEFIFTSHEEMGNTESFIDAVGDYNIPSLFKKARALGMNGIIVGSIQDLGINEASDDTGIFRSKVYSVQANVKLQLFDVTNEKELLNQSATAEISEEHLEYFLNRTSTTYDPERGHLSVFKALEKILPLIPRYARKIAWTGTVAKVEVNRIYITAGELSGIPKGQLLKVYGDSVPVYEPGSSRLLGTAPGRFKGVLRIIEHFGNDGSIAVVHSGGGFREKDRVELFTSISH